MVEDILTPIVNFIVNTISAGGYIGVAALMAIESAAIPLPSEIIMPFAGFLVSEGRFTLFGASLAGAIGSVLGSWILYFMARKGGRPLVEKYGRYVLVSAGDLKKTDQFFNKYGAWATFIGRMLPVVRTYISFPAGLARARFWPFPAAAFVGSFIWSYFLAYLGMQAGVHWEAIRDRLEGFDIVIVIIIVIVLAWYIWRHVKDRRIDKSSH